jgi:hypothetical protein
VVVVSSTHIAGKLRGFGESCGDCYRSARVLKFTGAYFNRNPALTNAQIGRCGL